MMFIGGWLLFLFAAPRRDALNALQRIKKTDNGTVWIDVENVRGKTGFELTHNCLLNKTSHWTKHHGLEGKVIAVVDHGSENTAVYLDDLDIAVAFSGREKADDVIANGVNLFESSIVVTADGGLRSRCLRSAGQKVINLDPMRFIDDLEATDGGSFSSSAQNIDQRDLYGRSNIERSLDDEIRLQGQLLDAESQFGKKNKATNKRKKKLQSKIKTLRARLASRGRSLLDEMTTTDASMVEVNESMKQDLLLSRWQGLRQQSTRREQTGDRVILAEWLRRQLVVSSAATMEFAETEVSPAKAFVRHFNQNQFSRSTHQQSENEALRVLSGQAEPSTLEQLSQHSNETEFPGNVTMIVISDTHGFEYQLMDQGQSTSILPGGDILLHLGDFAVDGSKSDKERGLAKFDQWLARQPHKYKIVVRGNHDPLVYGFPLSKSWFVTKPSSATIANLTFGFVPYGSPRQLAASRNIPKECDVFVSHLPPFRVLDRTCTKKNAGSPYLTKVVRSMKGKVPKIWLCGHIHEARGKMEHKFADALTTTVVNAANANSGRAAGVVHKHVTICMKTTDSKEFDIQGLATSKKGYLEPLPSHFENHREHDNELLMAVDLGLKSGVALYNKNGELLRYEQLLFKKDSLDEEIKKIIQGWESEIQSSTITAQNADKPCVTKIAVEGGDVEILRAWDSAAMDVSVTRISPEEWRFHLLSPKERLSGATSKAAARLIARQVVDDFSSMKHEGKFKTDVAEAVVLGFYVCQKLGWISRDPIVRRYTNGNVIVPR